MEFESHFVFRRNWIRPEVVEIENVLKKRGGGASGPCWFEGVQLFVDFCVSCCFYFRLFFSFFLCFLFLFLFFSPMFLGWLPFCLFKINVSLAFQKKKLETKEGSTSLK